ncbi:hypothetical protein ACFX2F_034771 [Malus domestica]
MRRRYRFDFLSLPIYLLRRLLNLSAALPIRRRFLAQLRALRRLRVQEHESVFVVAIASELQVCDSPQLRGSRGIALVTSSISRFGSSSKFHFTKTCPSSYDRLYGVLEPKRHYL